MKGLLVRTDSPYRRRVLLPRRAQVRLFLRAVAHVDALHQEHHVFRDISRVIADPFLHTAELTELLRVRARQLTQRCRLRRPPTRRPAARRLTSRARRPPLR